jgi:hypothetical protein
VAVNLFIPEATAEAETLLSKRGLAYSVAISVIPGRAAEPEPSRQGPRASVRSRLGPAVMCTAPPAADLQRLTRPVVDPWPHQFPRRMRQFSRQRAPVQRSVAGQRSRVISPLLQPATRVLPRRGSAGGSNMGRLQADRSPHRRRMKDAPSLQPTSPPPPPARSPAQILSKPLRPPRLSLKATHV